jgi:hypothetical protein
VYRADPLTEGFCSTILGVDVLPSGFRHGVEAEDIEHSLRNAVVIEEVGEDLSVSGDRIGPAGNLLELVVMDRFQGPAVIHAVALRAKYRKLLPGGG